jgi:tetratricopeptide repeat protein
MTAYSDATAYVMADARVVARRAARARMRWIPPARRVFALWAMIAAGVAAPITAQDEIVESANQAYQSGEYLEAIDAYEAVLDAGFTSAGLEYNLGNAYFKSGDLGRSILHWERALSLSPGDPDTRANLDLARSLTVDVVEPLPTFWLFSLVTAWVRLLPRGALLVVVATGWLALSGGVIMRLLARTERLSDLGRWLAAGGAFIVMVMGANLVVREFGVGTAERAVVLVEAVSVRSAPANDDDLTLFEVHEGTRVRIDHRTGDWAEVVLDDGKVGWVPLEVMEVI